MCSLLLRELFKILISIKMLGPEIVWGEAKEMWSVSQKVGLTIGVDSDLHWNIQVNHLCVSE